MSELYVYDAAYAPNLSLVKGRGGIAVNGYLTGIYAASTAQWRAAHAEGLGYVPTYEEGPAELVHATRAGGQAVGRKILAAFQDNGLPLDGTVAVYPSVDVNVPGADASACNAGWQGIRDIIAGRISVRAYAEGAVIDALANAGLVDGKCWLAAPTSWPGFDVNDAHVCMVQLVGSAVGGTDQNHLVTDPHALGAFWPEGSPYGGTVALTGADADTLWNRPILLDDGTTKWTAAHVLKRAYTEAQTARTVAATALEVAQTAVQILSASKTGVSDRVASTGSALAALQKQLADLARLVAAETPAAELKLDEAKIAADLAPAVVAGIKGLSFKATV